MFRPKMNRMNRTHRLVRSKFVPDTHRYYGHTTATRGAATCCAAGNNGEDNHCQFDILAAADQLEVGAQESKAIQIPVRNETCSGAPAPKPNPGPGPGRKTDTPSQSMELHLQELQHQNLPDRKPLCLPEKLLPLNKVPGFDITEQMEKHAATPSCRQPGLRLKAPTRQPCSPCFFSHQGNQIRKSNCCLRKQTTPLALARARTGSALSVLMEILSGLVLECDQVCGSTSNSNSWALVIRSFSGMKALPRKNAEAATFRVEGNQKYVNTFVGLDGAQAANTITEVKKWYRQLALKHHPDKGGSRKDWDAVAHAYQKRMGELGAAGFQVSQCDAEADARSRYEEAGRQEQEHFWGGVWKKVERNRKEAPNANGKAKKRRGTKIHLFG